MAARSTSEPAAQREPDGTNNRTRDRISRGNAQLIDRRFHFADTQRDRHVAIRHHVYGRDGPRDAERSQCG